MADAAEEAFHRLKPNQKLDEETAEGFIMRAVRKASERISPNGPWSTSL
ncbi:MAG: hypothetical protein HC777_03940 [Hyphomonadaceae bacterium]|nr:hypothetical protein [Hyphomonadaceae bacterium]